MKKSDLKTGMRVELRNGSIYLVLKDIESMNYGHQDIAFIRHGGFQCGNVYYEDLTHTNKYYNKYDVVKVYSVALDELNLLNADILYLNTKYLMWEREEFPRLGDMYYYPSIDVNSGYEESVYDNDSMDNNRKSRVGIYETREEAINRARELAWIK